MTEKKIKKAGILLFAAMLTVPLLLTSFKSDVESVIEKRTLANFPSLHTAEGEWNSSFIQDFENWFNDHVGLRQLLFEGNSRLMYDLFDTSAISKVEVGKEGWLYYTEGSNLEIAAGLYPGLEEKDLEVLCAKLCMIRDYLAEQGIDYVLFFPPSKVSIYPEYIPGDFSVRKTPVDIVEDYLETHSDLKVIRLKEDLLKAKTESEELLYFKTDTHWNAYGTYVGYQTIIRQLKDWGMIQSDPAEVKLIREDTIRDLSKMLVTEYDNYLENALSSYEVQNPTAVLQKKSPIYRSVQEYIAEHSIYDGSYFENENKEQPSFLAFSDSMVMGWMQELLAENCSSLTAVRDNEIRQELIDLVQPDVVFTEMTERRLNLLGEYSLDLIRSSVETDKEKGTMTITYHDFGEYSEMRFAVWSEEEEHDDLIWYEAERSDSMSWQVTVKLQDHPGAGPLNIHYYQYSSAEDPGSNMKMEQVDVDAE